MYYDSPSSRRDPTTLRTRIFITMLAAIALTLEFLDDVCSTLN